MTDAYAPTKDLPLPPNQTNISFDAQPTNIANASYSMATKPTSGKNQTGTSERGVFEQQRDALVEEIGLVRLIVHASSLLHS